MDPCFYRKILIMRLNMDELGLMGALVGAFIIIVEICAIG